MEIGQAVLSNLFVLLVFGSRADGPVVPFRVGIDKACCAEFFGPGERGLEVYSYSPPSFYTFSGPIDHGRVTSTRSLDILDWETEILELDVSAWCQMSTRSALRNHAVSRYTLKCLVDESRPIFESTNHRS